MIILVLNCGSSSIKYQVLDMKSKSEHKLLAKGLVERIGLEEGNITHSVPGSDKYKMTMPIKDHTAGIKAVLGLLTDNVHGVLKSLKEIEAVGHRIVHGGEAFNKSCIINNEVIEGIKACSALAPLHNPAGLLGIAAVSANLPGVPQVAVFDTSFFSTIPDYAYIYGVPYKYYTEDKVRKYGFHGTSHRYVSAEGARFTGMDYAHSKIVTCHLGNGGSVTATLDGKAIDTTLGLTTVDGVLMGTRCGAIDPGALIYIMQKHKLNADQMSNIILKESGFLGVSGVSPDMRDVEEAAAKGNKRAKLAIEIFCYRIAKYVGSYAAAMNGIDLLVFTGGIGENDANTRKYVAEHLSFLGISFDEDANENMKRGANAIISKKDSKVTVAVIPTDEELVIATDTMELVR